MMRQLNVHLTLVTTFLRYRLDFMPFERMESRSQQHLLPNY